MRQSLSILPIILALGLSACSSNPLDRDRAASLISSAGAFHASLYDDVPQWGSGPCSDYPKLLALRNLGLLQVTENTGPPRSYSEQMLGGGPKSCSATFTPEGRRDSAAWRSEDMLFQPIWSIPIATRQLIQVSGVSQPQGSVEAVATFTWRWVPNRVGQALGGVDTRIYSSNAVFRLYDDGWRLENLQL